MSGSDLLSTHAKTLCDAHQCPRCATRDHITIERHIEGTVVVTQCHCRLCGFSWHPTVAGA
jgi:hypothetical protein